MGARSPLYRRTFVTGTKQRTLPIILVDPSPTTLSQHPLLIFVIFITVIKQPLRLSVFLVTNFKQPLRIMTSFVTVLFKDRYGLKPSNRLVKRPLPLWLISNGRCGGVVGLGHARTIGNARCSALVTDVLLCNGLLAPVTNAVLPILGFHVVNRPMAWLARYKQLHIVLYLTRVNVCSTILISEFTWNIVISTNITVTIKIKTDKRGKENSNTTKCMFEADDFDIIHKLF